MYRNCDACFLILVCQMASAGSQSEDTASAGSQSEDTSRPTWLCPAKLGIAHDAVSLGHSGATFGFGIAKVAANASFGFTSSILQRSASALATSRGENSRLVGALRGADQMAAVAHSAITTSQDMAQSITLRSLDAANDSLKAAGAREGELYRRALGDEAGDAFHAVLRLVSRESAPLAAIPPWSQMKALRQWSTLQNVSRQQAYSDSEEATLPENSERWLRFSAASFGAESLGGLIEPVTTAVATAAKRARGDPVLAALSVAGVTGEVDVVRFEKARDQLFSPGYLVAVDHETGYVVVALRGTNSSTDLLADLVCEPVPIQLAGMDGFAHDGMWRAAQRLDEPIREAVETALASFSGPRRVVVCGHSLGAGVASLLTAIWRDGDRFPGVDVRCFAFACPQVLDAGLAQTMANNTVSFIVGDDLVPRLSASSVIDLREALLCLLNPTAYGLDENFVDQDEAVAHAAVRRVACTSKGRLCPSGRLLHLLPGQHLQYCGPHSVDELIISKDMAAAHMPKRYLNALRSAYIDPVL